MTENMSGSDGTERRVAARLLFETDLGWIGISWSEGGLTHLVLPQRDRAALERRLAALSGAPAADERDAPGWVRRLASGISRYARGEAVGFDWAPVDLGEADSFRRDIYAAARRLAFGEITTYGGLAEAAGHPGKARETGEALGRNPVPLVVPCHRIIAAGGRIGGFSAYGGSAAKERLLKLEGVRLGPPEPAQSSFAF